MKAIAIALALALSTAHAATYTPAPQVVNLGEFEVTAYAEDGITATGTIPTPMHTVAVDPNVIPYGSKLYIEDLDLYVIAEDCGGAVKGDVIDLFVGGTEPETASFGRQHHNVYMLVE